MRSGPLSAVVALLLALGCQEPATPVLQLVPPPCVRPAPLLGEADARAPGYIVAFEDGVDARQEANRLAARYHFAPTDVYEFALSGFSAELTPSVVAAVRCEVSVRYVEHNARVTIHG